MVLKSFLYFQKCFFIFSSFFHPTFLVMVGTEPTASRMLGRCSNTELQSQPNSLFSIESKPTGTHRSLQSQDQVQPSPLPRKPSHYIGCKKPCGAVKGVLLWGRGTPNLRTLHLGKPCKERKQSSFSKSLQFCRFSLKQQAKHRVVSSRCSVCLAVRLPRTF